VKKRIYKKQGKKEIKNARIIISWLADPRVYLVPILVLFACHTWRFQFFIMDDAFTSFRYAQNLIDGYGLVYNIGEKVEGYTNFLWTLIIACFMKAGLSPEPTSQVLGVISGCAGIILTFLLSSLIAPKSRFFALIAPLFLSINTCFAVWSIAGMEISFFTSLILLATTRYIYETQNREKMPLSPAIFGIASLARPEGLLFFGVTFIHQAILLLKKRVLPKKLFISLLLFCSIFLPYYIWRYTYYGWPLPNTFYAKVGTGIEQYMRGILYIKNFLFEFSGWIFLVIPFAFRRLNSNLSYILIITISWLLYVVYVGGDALPAYRFLVPILPFLYLMTQEGAVSFYGAVSGKKASVFIFVLIALGTLFTAKNSLSGKSLEGVKIQASLTNVWTIVGKWLRENASPTDSVALSPAGAIPYYSKLYTIDMLGLNDLHIGHMRLEGFGKGKFAGHEKGDGAYILSRKPTYILLGNVILLDESEFDFTEIPWNNWALRSERELWFNPKFHQIYEQVASHIGGGWYLHYFRLKEKFLDKNQKL
jgi:hypothetical protein